MAGGKWKLRHTRERLMARIQEMPNGCWEWTGYVNPNGYGTCSYNGRRGTLAHRAVYVELKGPIAEGMSLDHLCHTRDHSCMEVATCRHRRCVNPDHLEQVEPEENSSRGIHGRKTRCPQGHPYDENNTEVRDGRRFCRACQRDRSRRASAARSAVRAAARIGATK